MFKIENINKSFNTQKVLDNLSCNIDSNKFCAIVGDSGSGKTTLLNMIGGLGYIDSGDIYYNGISYKDRNMIEEIRNKEFSFIFQDYYLELNFIVLDNIVVPLLAKDISYKDAIVKAKEISTKLGLDELLYKKTKLLSGGEKQRVAIARALINNPKVIFADEPTGNLDVKNGNNIMNILRNIVNDGCSVIMVTHNIEHIKLCDQVISISDGKVI